MQPYISDSDLRTAFDINLTMLHFLCLYYFYILLLLEHLQRKDMHNYLILDFRIFWHKNLN